jgi:polar amino acid transport system permease protein
VVAGSRGHRTGAAINLWNPRPLPAHRALRERRHHSHHLHYIRFVLYHTYRWLTGGLGRISKNRYINGATSLYVEVIRGIPLMVQLMWWYFAFPEVIQGVGRSMQIDALATYRANPYAMAVIGLVICYGAYMSEIYRAGIQSIPKGQMEAARSMGMSYIQGMRYVIIPQAIRVIMPPVGNEFVALLKDSSLVSVVAVSDLTRRGREFSAMTYDPVPTWMMVALLYLVLTLVAARVVTFIEKKMSFER